LVFIEITFTRKRAKAAEPRNICRNGIYPETDKGAEYRNIIIFNFPIAPKHFEKKAQMDKFISN